MIKMSLFKKKNSSKKYYLCLSNSPSLNYEVGKTYSAKDNSYKRDDLFFYYTSYPTFSTENPYFDNFTVFQIEILGDDESIKTDKIKIVKKLSKTEIKEEVFSFSPNKKIYKFDENNNLIWYKNRKVRQSVPLEIVDFYENFIYENGQLIGSEDYAPYQKIEYNKDKLMIAKYEYSLSAAHSYKYDESNRLTEIYYNNSLYETRTYRDNQIYIKNILWSKDYIITIS
jgi:hypothetical protein